MLERAVTPMNYTFEKLTPECEPLVTKYSSLRPIYTSEGQFINQYIWSDFYGTEFAYTENYMFFKMKIKNEYATMMPYCKVEHIEQAFFEIKDYFNNVLNVPLKMYIVDELFLNTIKQSERFQTEFSVEEMRDAFDYIYDAEKLRTLSGKSYHKKKNHLNAFKKAYEGRYEYRTLHCCDTKEISDFHMEWLQNRNVTERLDAISSEESGVFRLLDHCSLLPFKMGGVYVDGKLSAYSIGSYNPELKCAFIHIEKGSVDIRGIYNYINQQFIINEFPDAEIVNREDDLGEEGLRKSKLSYRPIRLEQKFNLFQK